MHLPHRIFVFGIISLMALAIACTSSEADPIPTAAPAATSTPVPDDDHADDGHDEDEGHEADAEPVLDLVERGQAVYAQVGCAACHGEDGSGTEIAPGLPGHNELQVRRQVRGPIGIMPVFGRDALSQEDLDALVAYVEGLTGEHTHGHDSGAGDIPLPEQSLAHHRMALTAFEADNVEEAEHHIDHLISLLDGQHLALMQEALSLTQSGEYHDAQHLIEGMLSDVQPADETFATLHLKLGLSSLRVVGTDEATHHLAHAGAVAEGDELTEINEILVMLTAGETHEAEEHLSALLGLDAIGLDDAHEEEDDHAHEAEADATHEEGDEHATDEHDADATHEEGDEHATDEHDAEATHEEGDEHATDEHDADAALEEGDEHDAVASDLTPISEAIEAIEAGDLELAATEIGHFVEGASTIDRLKAEEALASLTAGNIHDAEDVLRELLGDTEHAH